MKSIKMFLDDKGKVKQFPMKNGPKRAVLGYLAEKFDVGIDYTEKEVNAILQSWHTFSDFHLLRRELIDGEFLCRTNSGSRYWKEEKVAEEITKSTATQA